MIDQHGEHKPDEQNAPPVPARRFGYLLQAVVLAGVVTLTAVITLWVSRDAEKSGVEIVIPDSPPVTFQVSGEVLRPGVYSLEGEPRVNDAIDAAGGLTPDADDRLVNLALHVRDGAKVVIPSLHTADNDSGANDEVTSSANGTDTANSVVDSAVEDPQMVITGSGDDSVIATNSSSPTGLIDLNTATKNQLVNLPGIGEVRADSIIEWRTNNLISSASDLLAISGIGPATVDSIRTHVIQP